MLTRILVEGLNRNQTSTCFDRKKVNKTKILTTIILTLLISSTAFARYCNNPYCSMCNRIFGPMPGYSISNGKVFRNTRSRPRPTVDTTLEPMPREAVSVMLSLVSPKSTDTLYDLGCGDGRVLIEAVKRHNCFAVGIELNKETVKIAEENVKNFNNGNKILIIEGDITDYKFDKAHVITIYLFPELISKVKDRFPVGARVVSYSHDIPGIETTKKEVEVNGNKHLFYIWTVPNKDGSPADFSVF